MRRMLTITLVLALLVLGNWTGHGSEPPKPSKKEELMRRKLTNSQKILEGIAIGDHKLIEKHAEELMQISKEAAWKVLNTPAYDVHSNAFRRTLDAMIENARDKNLDAAALNYVDLTLTCVKCHKHVREVRMTSLD